MGRDSEIQIILRAKDEFTKELKKVQSELNRLSKDIESVRKASQKTGKEAASDFSLFGKHIGDADKQARTLVGTLGGLGKLRLFQAIGGFIAFRSAARYISEGVTAALEAQTALAKLTQIVQTSTGATREQVLALAEQAKHLEDVGVVQAEVTMAAQGTLSTFDLQADSIKALIPSFLNMVVAERGVNATTDDMIGLANGLGKVLQGQTGALSKQGFIFSETQEEMLKYGTEAEKVIAITEILDSTYAGLNERMRDTAQGRLKGLQFALDDVQKSVGNSLIPTLEVLADEFVKTIKGANGLAIGGDGLARTLYSVTHGLLGVARAAAIAVIGLGGMVNITLFGAFKAWWEIIKGIGESLFSLGSGVKKLFSGDIEGAMEDFKSIDISDIFSDGLDAFKDNAAATFESVKELTAALIDDMKTNFSEAFNQTNFKMPGVDIPAIGLGEGGLDGALEELDELESKLKPLISVFRKFNDGMEKFDEQLKKAKESARESISSIRDNLKEKLKDISDSISQVNLKISELREEFAKGFQTDKNDLASQFVEAEERVKSLKEELARATDAQDILDIKTKIKEEEKALSDTKDVQMQFAQEIANARNHTSMSELEQAIADYNSRRSIAEQELSEQLSVFEAEKQALRDKRDEEKRLSEEKIEEVRMELSEKKKIIAEERKEFLAAVTNELLVEQGKSQVLKQLADEVQRFRQQVTKTATNNNIKLVEEEIRAYERLASAMSSAVRLSSSGSKKKVDDAVISPSGDIVSTNPKDWLIASQNPGGLLGGGSSIVVNINGGTYLSEDVAEQIGDMLVDRLQFSTRLS